MDLIDWFMSLHFNWYVLTASPDMILRHLDSLFANDVASQNWFDALFWAQRKWGSKRYWDKCLGM